MLIPAQYKSTKVFPIETTDIFEHPIYETFYWASQEYKGCNYVVDSYQGSLIYADSRCNCAVRSINTI